MASTYQLRPAGAADHRALARLAALDDAAPITGDVLMAFSDGDPVAAMSLHDGRVVADPFHHTADAVDLLRFRARQQRSSRTPGGRLRFPGFHRLAAG